MSYQATSEGEIIYVARIRSYL